MSRLSDIYKILHSRESDWKKNLILMVIAQLIAMAGMSACVPFLPIFVRDLGITDMNEAKFWSSIVFAGPYVLSIFAVPVWGTLGDKYGRKPMVIRAILGLAVSMFLMGFSQNVWQLFFLRVFQGLASGFIAASLSFVSAETPVEKSGFAISMLQSAQSAGTILGPFAGGLFSDLVGIRPVFFIVAVLCLISGLLIIFLVKENNFSKNQVHKINTIKYFRETIAVPEIRIILLLIIISQAGIHFSTPVFPYFVERLNTPPEFLSTITGVMVGLVGVFSIIFAPMWGRRNDRKNYNKTILVSSIIVGIVTILQLLVTDWLVLIPFRVIIGIFLAGIIPTLYSALSKISKKETVGSAMSIASSANLFGALMSFLFCAWVSSAYGIDTVFIVSGILLASVSVILLIRRK